MNLLHEKKLVDRFNQGDADAFKVIFIKQRLLLIRTILRFVASKETAEDIASDSLIKLWQARGRFETLANIAAYVNRVAANACIDYLRHRSVELDHIEQVREIFEEVSATEESNLIRDYLKAIVYVEIEKLPRKMRAIFKLSFIEGLTNTEISEKLNLSEKTVRNKKAIAIKKIKRIIGREP